MNDPVSHPVQPNLTSSPTNQSPHIRMANDQAGQTSAFTAYASVGGFGAVSSSGGSPSVLLMNSHATLSRDGESFTAYRNDNLSSSMMSGSGIAPVSTASSSPENVRSALLGAIDSHGANESGEMEGPVRISDILNDLGVRDHSATLPPTTMQSSFLGEGEVRDDTYMPKSYAAQGGHLSQHANSTAQHSSEGRFKIEPAQYYGPGSAFRVDAMKGIEPSNPFNNPLVFASGNPELSEGFSVSEAADAFLASLEASDQAGHEHAQREAPSGMSRNYSAGLHQPTVPELQTPSGPLSSMQALGGSEGNLTPESRVFAELLIMAGKIGIKVNLEATPLEPFGYSASLDLGGMKLLLPGPFKTEIKGKAAVCQKGLLLLKPMMLDDQPSYGRTSEDQTSESALVPPPAAPCEPPVAPNTPICRAKNMEAAWQEILGKWSGKNRIREIKYVPHMARLGPKLSECWRFDMILGEWTFSCYDYYTGCKAAKRAVAKVAVVELWKSGSDIEIPQEVVQLFKLKRQEEGRHEPQLAQTVNKKQVAPPPPPPPPYQFQGATGTWKNAKYIAQAHYWKRGFSNRRSQLQGDPWTAENAIALGPRRLRELTRDEIMAANKTPSGREPDSFEGLLTKINSLCYTLQIHVPFFEIIPDSIGDDVFSGAAIFPPHPLVPNARVGEVLHVFGRQRAKELCAIGVLVFLEELAANTAITRESGGLRDSTNIHEGRKRKAEETEDGRHLKVERRE